MRALSVSISAIALLLVSTVSLHAAGACKAYGDLAVADARRAAELNCGFNGPRYSTDGKLHVRWCVGVKDETKTEEQGDRSHQLSKCAMCRDYSNAANAAQRENISFRCGFEGPQWTLHDGGSSDGHFQWCMNSTETDYSGAFIVRLSLDAVKQSRMDPESDSRKAAINECKGKFEQKFSQSEVKRCRDYRDKAVNAANFNVQNKCGATPVSRWSRNAPEHFFWCLAQQNTDEGKALIDSEEKARDASAHLCQEGLKLTESGAPIRPTRKMGRNKPNPAPAGAKTIERQMSLRAAGGDNAGKSAASPRGAMDLLTGPTGGENLVRSEERSARRKPPILSPAAIVPPRPSSASTPTVKSFGRSGGGDSSVDYGFGGPAAVAPRAVR